MRLMTFVVWLSVGAILGWFARVMYELEYLRPYRIKSDEVQSSEEN